MDYPAPDSTKPAPPGGTTPGAPAPERSTQTQTATATAERTDRPWLWNVVLIDDDEHSYDYVIRMAQELFSANPERAFRIAKSVDSDGRAICLTTHREHAELKLEQIIAFGRDPIMAISKGPMTAIIEPAEFGGDDSEGDSSGPSGPRSP